MIQKLDIAYAVKASLDNYKEVDMAKRTVDLIANTYNFYDSDGDVLLPGCCKKSIEERGPRSNATGKIKHFYGHDSWQIIARPDLIEETTHQGKDVLRANSYFPETEESETHLVKYQEGLYDQHSIGFRYINLELGQKETADEASKRLYYETLEKLINPEDAEKNGFIFVVKEIALYEYSTVAFGANRLTPYLGSKSENKTIRYANLIKKLDALLSQAGKIDRDLFEIHERQLKQMIYELFTDEPLRPITPPEPKRKDTQQVDVNKIINNIKIKL